MWEEATDVISANSGADYSKTGAQLGSNRFVTIQSDGRFLLSSANDQAVGVLTRDTFTDVAGRVVISGTVPVLLGGTVTAGQAIGAGALGVGLATATTKLGIALVSGVAGNVVPVKLGISI